MPNDNAIFDYFEVNDTRDVRSSARWDQFCSEAGIPTDSAYFIQGRSTIAVVLEDGVNEYTFSPAPGNKMDFSCTRSVMLHRAEPTYEGPSGPR